MKNEIVTTFFIATTVDYKYNFIFFDTQYKDIMVPATSTSNSTSTSTMDTTRVCIKNLPPSCNESDLKSHLNSISTSSIIITDCKILKTKDGKSRKLAFVGFKTFQMAQNVVSFFHKTYLGTSRLSVELAFSKGSSSSSSSSDNIINNNNNNRPWSKYSVGSSRHDSIYKVDTSCDNHVDDDEKKKNDKNEKTKEKIEKIDKKKEEFLAVMMGSKKGDSAGKLWDNDDGMNVKNNECGGDNDNHDDDTSDASTSSSSSSDEDEDDVKIIKNRKDQGEQLDSPPKEVEKESQSSSTSEFASDRLFVRNLPFYTTEEEVKDVFSTFGHVIECHIPVDDSNHSKGYAFVKFAHSKDASEAKQQLDGSSFQGRLIHVLPARPERDNKDNNNTTSNDEGGSSTHKKKMEIARQQGATEPSAGWSSNFVRGDAVVDTLADRFQLDKGALFNIKDGLSAGNAAVRLALGETQVLEENRDFFQQFGIQMDALESSSTGKDSIKRSCTMILVKNLPYDTTKDDLSKLFLSDGAEADILLPPSRTIALVDYKKPVDAKRAFRKLSYRRFKHVPLYLEWAPVDIKKPSGKADETISGETVPEVKMDNEGDEDITNSSLMVSSIYVKNLNFSTTETDVWKAFEDVIGKQLRSVRIPMKAAPVKANNSFQSKEDQVQQLSMGYGFVECCSEEAAKKAIKSLQGKVINGHAMELKISSKSNSMKENDSQVLKKNSTKLIVRNVPFQASRTDILQLFGSFGQLKTVRLPKKCDGGHRGFAFVEFTVVKEAQNAMKGLSQTHLYGRHLVIEWAKEGETEIVGLKTKRDPSIMSEVTGKNKKIRFNT